MPRYVVEIQVEAPEEMKPARVTELVETLIAVGRHGMQQILATLSVGHTDARAAGKLNFRGATIRHD